MRLPTAKVTTAFLCATALCCCGRPAEVASATVAAAAAATKPAGKAGRAGEAERPAPPSTKPTAAFPGPAVDKLLKGWDDAEWGSPLAAFKERHPAAKQVGGGRWVTGRGPTDLADRRVTAEYGFNRKSELALIRFEPEASARKTFVRALADAGVTRPGPKPGWTKDGVSLVLAELDGEPFAVALNARFTDPAGKKPAAAPQPN